MLRNDNTYIMNLEGKYIVNGMERQGKFDSTRIDFNKLYGGSLPYSLDMIELDRRFPKEILITDNGNRQYTNAIVNVTFNNSIYENIENEVIDKATGEITTKISKKTKYTKKNIRKELYKNGFKINDDNYVLYKRSSSKARQGSCLFIKKELFQDMISYSRLGLVFKDGEKVDLASLKAYESLTLSSIERTITIDPNSILLISDIKKDFKEIASVTRSNNKDVIVGTEMLERKGKYGNDIFDGQSLVDESLFDNGKGMMLLRNRFFKSCGFNTKIQKYFKDNNIETVKDMFGVEHKAKDIKVITTPNSVKFLKFADKIGTNQQAYQYWLGNISSQFGVCKSEKPSHFGSYNQLSYQMINSLPLSYDEVQELMKEEIEYVNLLKDDLAVFRNHIHMNNTNITREFIYNLLAVSDKVKYTKMFKDFRRNVIDNYLKSLRKGKIKINNTDYATITGNPFEMLKLACGEEIKDTLHKYKEIYCSAFKDGEMVAGFRNPHVCSGNVLLAKNVFKKEFKEYFNFTDNIVVINSTDNDIYDRLQGCDLDSDCLLITNNKIIVEKAKQCVSYPTPVNKTDKSSEERDNTILETVEIDSIIAENEIGNIINNSQILNSYYWHEYNKENPNQKLLELIYNNVSILSSLSQIEIDRAKKLVDVQVSKAINKIKEIEFHGKKIMGREDIEIKNTKTKEVEVKNKMIRPYFFKYCGQGRNYCFKKFNTPMDYLEDILDKVKDIKRTKTIDIEDVLVKEKLDKGNRKQIQAIKDMVCKLDSDLRGIRAAKKLDKNRDKEQDKLMIENLQQEVIKKVSKMKMTKYTVLSIFNRCYSKKSRDKETSEYKRLLVSILYKAKPQLVLNSFKLCSSNVEYLVEDPVGKIEMFGVKYSKWRKETK